MALDVGSRLGHYDVTALIGEGGMGQVHLADTRRDARGRGVSDAWLRIGGTRVWRSRLASSFRPVDADRDLLKT